MLHPVRQTPGYGVPMAGWSPRPFPLTCTLSSGRSDGIGVKVSQYAAMMHRREPA